MSIVIPSSASEIVADPRRLLEDMRAGRVITLSDLDYTIAVTAIVVLSGDEIDELDQENQDRLSQSDRTRCAWRT